MASFTIQIDRTWGGGALRPSYLARVAEVRWPVARVQLEILGDDAFAVHINCDLTFQRRGFVSAMVDQAVRDMAKEGRRLLFEDEQAYRDKGGYGSFTEDGQAWADAYRLRHGISLPPTMVGWFGGPLVLRQQEAA